MQQPKGERLLEGSVIVQNDYDADVAVSFFLFYVSNIAVFAPLYAASFDSVSLIGVVSEMAF